MKQIIFIAISFCVLFACQAVIGQSKKDTISKIIIENANNQVTDATKDTVVKYFNGDVRAYHKGNFIFCDSAKMVGNTLFAWGNVSIIQHDTTRLFANRITYFGDDEKSELLGEVILESGKSKLFTSTLYYDLKTKKATYADNAQLENEASILKSKRGIYDVTNDKAYFYENVSIDGKDFKLLNDSLEYETETEIARWKTPTLIWAEKSKIYCEQGFYNIKTKNSEFIGNVQQVEEDKISNADTMTYTELSKTLVLKGNANYASDSIIASARIIKYNKATGDVDLTGDAYFDNKKNVAQGEAILYIKSTDSFSFSGGGSISDPPMIMHAISLHYSKPTGIGKAVGKVIWQDTSAHSRVDCDSLDIKSKESYFKAINFKGKPIFSTEVDGDTLFMSADTLLSFRKLIHRDSLGKVIDFPKMNLKDTLNKSLSIDSTLIVSTDTIKYMLGDNHVEMYKSDMQAVCDSFLYNSFDSVFTLMDAPIIWTDTTQLNGDTVFIFLKNKKMDRMNIIDNALVLTSTDLVFFNQIAGKKINATFSDGAIYKMKVNGNAKSLYYMLDDDNAYIGVNETEASFMVFDFKDNRISDVRSYTDPKSIIKPMKGTNHDALKLKGFDWKINVRPKSKDDLKY